MKRMMKRSLALITVIAMLLSLLAMPVFAEEESNLLSNACEHCQDVLFELPDEEGRIYGYNEDGELVCEQLEVVDPSCLDAVGYTKYACLVEGCGKIWTGNYVVVRADGSTGHNYVTTTTEATCAAPGHTKTECTYCHDVTEDKVLEQLTHTVYDENTNKNGSLVLDLEATSNAACKTDSVTVYSCQFCDYQEEVVHEGTGYDHTFVIDNVNSDRINGVTVVIVCTDCGKSVTATLGNLTCDHTSEYVVLSREKNCVDFKVTVTYCDECDVAVASGFEAATNHQLVDNAQLSYGATCAVDGLAVKTCSVCYGVNNEICAKEDAAGHTGCMETVIPAQGHWYLDDEQQPVYFDTPICTVFDEDHPSLTCESCGMTYTKDNTHDYETVEKAATCLTAGGIYNVCKHCGDEYVDNYVAPLGHNLVWEQVYDPKEDGDYIHAVEWAYVCDREGCDHVEETRYDESAYKLQFDTVVKNEVKDGADVVNGGFISYTISLKSNQLGVEAFQLAVAYDASKLTCAGYSVCENGVNAFGFTYVEYQAVAGVVSISVANENRVGNVNTDLDFEDEEIVTLYFRVNADSVAEGALYGYSTNIDLYVVDILDEEQADLEAFVYNNAAKTVEVGVLGDVNDSAYISLVDVRDVQTIILNKEYVSSADIDQDGDVDVADLAAMWRYLNKTDDYTTFIGA